MKFAKSPPERVAQFDTWVPEDPAVERRKMFGYPCAFVGGHLFMGLHGPEMILRLDEPGREELGATPGARVFEPMRGRPMREYLIVPESVLRDSRARTKWIARALEYASTLPPKAKRAAPGARKRSARARKP